MNPIREAEINSTRKEEKQRNILKVCSINKARHDRKKNALEPHCSTFYTNDDINTHFQLQYPILSEACLPRNELIQCRPKIGV